MKTTTENFDWHLFWFLEVIFLSAPTLIAVVAFKDGASLSPHRATILGFVLLGLTVFNVIAVKGRAVLAGRFENR